MPRSAAKLKMHYCVGDRGWTSHRLEIFQIAHNLISSSRRGHASRELSTWPQPASGVEVTTNLWRNDRMLHHRCRGRSCVCRLPARVRTQRRSRPASSARCYGAVFPRPLPFGLWWRRSAACRTADNHRVGSGTDNVRRGEAAQRKMQMGVSGRALGIGVALERPVGPDRRNDVWAVAGTGKSSLTRSL